MNNLILLIAGEVSGDIHGASLLREMKIIHPELKTVGIGGDRMQAEGLEVIHHIREMAFLGFVEVIKHLPFIRKVQQDIFRIVKKRDIKNVVLIDYPGFNLNIARKLKKMGLNIYYFISPQLWAWGRNRINKMKNFIDHMFVVFPFEEKMYKQAGIPVTYVGHPLIEQINEYQLLSKEDFFKQSGLDETKEILLLLPGSRSQEVNKIFPRILPAAEELADRYNFQIVVVCSENIDEKIFRGLTKSKNYTLLKGYIYELMKYSRIGIIKSGTSTLQCALMALPMVIVYMTNSLTYLIGKSLIKIDKIGLANIVAGEMIVPELVQYDVTQEKIVAECRNMLDDPQKTELIRSKLNKLKKSLGEKNASQQVAEIILRLCYEN